MIAKSSQITRLTHVPLTLAVAILCSVTFVQAQDNVDKPDKDKEATERNRDRDRGPEAKKQNKDRDRDRPHPERAQRGDQEPKTRRPQAPRPPESKSQRDMPPEAREFSERVRSLHQEIGKLYREGNREAAHDVQEELMKFIRSHADMARRIGPQMRGHQDKPGHGRGPDRSSPGNPTGHSPDRHRPHSSEDAMKHVRDELSKARKDGRREDAEKLRRHLEKMEQHHARRPGGPGDEANEIKRRIHHLNVAADNLDKGGLGDVADKIRQQAEDIGNEFRERRSHAENRGHGEQMKQEMRELRHIVGQLKKEIEQLKAEVRKRGKR